MRAVIQRVTRASVSVAGAVRGSIEAGLVVLVGVEQGDTEEDARYLADKIAGLRIFRDEEGRMNRSVRDTGGACLVVSQFTLLADTRRGRRPGFAAAADPAEADTLYQRVCALIAEAGVPVATGVFQAMMQLELINDGPVTILVDSRKRF